MYDNELIKYTCNKCKQEFEEQGGAWFEDAPGAVPRCEDCHKNIICSHEELDPNGFCEECATLVHKKG